MNITIPDVSAEVIMSTVEALSKRPGDISFITEYIGTGVTSAKRAVSFGRQLGIIEDIGDQKFSVTNQCKSISCLYHEEPQLIFKNALYRFEPFILCASLIIRDNSVPEAIRKMRAVYTISSDEKVIKQVFNNFCRYIGFKDLSKESLVTTFNKNELSVDFAKKIITRLNNEFEISSFMSEKLGDQCFAWLDSPEKNLIVKAILAHQLEPANSISDFGGSFETFLRKIGKEKGVNLESSNGISQIGQVLGSKETKLILPEHRALCDFISTFRNPSAHKVQKNIVQNWNIGKDSSIEIILLGISTMRSIFEYVFNGKLLL